MPANSSGASLYAPHPTIPFLFLGVTDSTSAAGIDPITFCLFRGNGGAAPSTDVNTYHHGCIALVVDAAGNGLYQNTGTYASPVWNLIETAGAGGLTLPATATDTTTTTGTSLAITANSITSGVGESLTATAVTSGIIYEAVAAAATLTTGFYFAANDGALNVFTVGANGHLASKQTTAPTIAVGTQAGITAAAVTAGSTDTCGTITTTGTSTGGTIITLTFNKTYTTAPKFVVLSAANAAGGGVNTPPVVTATSATTFVFTIPAAGTYAATPSWTYLVVS